MKIKNYPNKEKLDPTDLFVIQEENGETKNIKSSALPSSVGQELSDTSANPVQNKVIKEALDNKLSTSGGNMSGHIDSSINPTSWLGGVSGENSAINLTKPNLEGGFLSICSITALDGRFMLEGYLDNFTLAYMSQEKINSGANTPDYLVYLLNEQGDTRFPGTVFASSYKDGYITSGQRSDIEIGLHATAEGTYTTSTGNDSHWYVRSINRKRRWNM